LAELEAGLPYETIEYVANAMACAIIVRNADHFGLTRIDPDASMCLARVRVPGGQSLVRIARTGRVTPAEIREWNPELLRDRVPAQGTPWPLRVSRTAGAHLSRSGFALLRDPSVRCGTPTPGARARFGRASPLPRPAADTDGVALPPSTQRRVPTVEAVPEARLAMSVVMVPARAFSYQQQRRHLFYRVRNGDRLADIAASFGVEMQELQLWNAVTPDAALQEGMVLQLFVPQAVDLSRVSYISHDAVRVLVVGSQPFFDYHERLRGRMRIRYRIQDGDTLPALAERFGLSVGSICRINRFGREHRLDAGNEIVLYANAAEPTPSSGSATVAWMFHRVGLPPR
jgi:LysM repeat protein